MKLKKNKTKSKVKKYDLGGNRGDGATEMGNSNLSQDWSNSQTAATPKSSISVGQGAGYAAQAVQGVSPLWTQSQYYTPPTQSVTNTVGNTVKGIASNIPIAGAFVQAGSMLGEGFQTGTNKAYDNIDKGKGNRATNQHGANAMAFFKGMSDPISNYTTIADAKKKGLISTGDAVGMGLSHLIGGSGISEAILQKKLHDYNRKQSLGEETNNFPVVNPNMPEAKNGLRGISKLANGGNGHLEQYNTGLHDNMPSDFANAQLDGKPIQLQRKETIFRKKNGGDYVFTDNLKNPETGNLISEDAKKIDKKSQKPFYDEASLKTKNFKMDKLANLNDKLRAQVEQKENGGNIDFPMYAKNGARGTYNVDGTFEQPGFIGTGGKIDELLNQDNPAYQTNFQLPQTNSELTMNGSGVSYIPNAPKLENRMKPLQPTENNLTPGDYAQLAGSAVAPLANLANYFRKPEKIKAYFDRSQITPTQQDINLNPLYLAENVGRAGINEGSTSDAIRRANLANLVSGTQQNVGNALLQNKQLNASLRGQFEDKIANRTRFNSAVATDRDTKQSQTNAVRQAYLNTGLGQLGQSAVDFGKMKNQGKTNEIEYSTLQSLAANYGLDPDSLADLYKAQGKVVLGYKKNKG